MTDPTVAPSGSAPAAAPTAPAAAEVPINPNPTTPPAPIGSQAPQAPTGEVKGSEHYPKSRAETVREAVQEAFKRAETPPPKPQKPPPKEAPKAAEAKPGHNKPPEKTEKFDLRKRPTEAAPPRGEHGHFVPKTPDKTPDKTPETAANGDVPSLAAAGNDARFASQPNASLPNPLPPNAPYRDPPARMADHAKAEWAAAPESIRGEVHRMHKEFAQAYEHYRGAAEAFQPIAHYHQMAQQHGTTLQKALDNYVGMEAKLRADPIAGLDLIVHNLGLKTETGDPIGLRDIAYHVLSQTPDQLRSLQQGNTVSAAQHQIGALHQQVANLQNAMQQMQYERQYNYTRSAIDQFAETHPRIDEAEFGNAVNQELQFGFDLPTAYRRAELLYPATQAAQTRTPSAQTREPTPDRSISGAPGGNANGAAPRPPGPPRSIRDSIAHAHRRVSNGF